MKNEPERALRDIEEVEHHPLIPFTRPLRTSTLEVTWFHKRAPHLRRACSTWSLHQISSYESLSIRASTSEYKWLSLCSFHSFLRFVSLAVRCARLELSVALTTFECFKAISFSREIISTEGSVGDSPLKTREEFLFRTSSINWIKTAVESARICLWGSACENLPVSAAFFCTLHLLLSQRSHNVSRVCESRGDPEAHKLSSPADKLAVPAGLIMER